MTTPAKELGQMLGQMSKQQSDLQSNAFGDEEEGLLNLTANENLVMTGSVTATAYYYASDSFVLDHPVYGELDSPVLRLDGGYLTTGGFSYPSWPMTWPHEWGVAGGLTVTALLYQTTF